MKNHQLTVHRRCTWWLPSGCKNILPHWCWSHPGESKWTGHGEPCQPPQRCPSVPPSASWDYLGTDVSAASSFEQRDVYAEPELPSCSCVQLEALILQRALCARCKFVVGMQLSITATAGLGSSFYSFNIIVVFQITPSMRLSFFFFPQRRNNQLTMSSALGEFSVGNPFAEPLSPLALCNNASTR